MDTLRTDQIRACADKFSTCAATVRRRARKIELDDPDKSKKLMNLSESIANGADILINKAVDVAVQDAQDPAQRIIESTQKAQAALDTINDIGKVLNIATAVLGLVGGIVTAITTGGIVGLGGLVGALDQSLGALGNF